MSKFSYIGLVIILFFGLAGELGADASNFIDDELRHDNGVRQEVIVLDNSIQDPLLLASELMQDNSVNYQVLYLNTEQDGIEQIHQHLKSQQNITAIHIYSHGSDGEIQLGNSWLSNENISIQQRLTLSKIKNYLSFDADILLYACDLASNSSGRELIAQLSEITKTDVHASNDVTGQKSAGGDWDLEFQLGPLETAVLKPTSWSGVLDPELTVTKVDSADPVAQNTDFTYTMVVTNIHSGGNNSNNAQNVELTDVLPAGMLYQSHTVAASQGTPGTCTTPAVGTNGTVTCDLGTIRRNNNFDTVTITVTPSQSGVFTNTADVVSTNAASVSVDEDTTITAVGGTADLVIEKTIVNDNSGTSVVGDFNILTSAGALTFGVPSSGVYTSNTLTVAAGTYTLVEDDVTGYTEGSWSCTDGTGLVSTFDNGSITLAAGDNAVCSITNDDTPPATGTSACESEGGTLSGNIFTSADNGTFGVSSSTAGGTIAPTAPYAGFFVAEIYDAAFPPNDGEYQILNQTPSSGFGSWDHPITDHTTGTTSGRFALSNMSNVLDSLFLQETVVLTADTNYELTIWVYNVCSSPPCDASHDPRLEFIVNDGLYLDTGLIPYTGGWSEQTFIFNSADNTSSLIKLVNKQALGTSGNDLAIDDYTIKECTLPNLGDITGTLYLDADGDNTFDTGETRLPANIRVNLYGSDGVLYSHTDTDANGDYEFIDVPIAFNDYSIEVDLSDTDIPSGYSIGTPNPIAGVTVVTGSSVDDQDFGFDTSTTLTIVKQVVNDEGGTATVTNFGITTSAGSLTFDGGVGAGATKTYTATTLSVVPGTYTLIENDVAGYAEGSWSCDEGTLVNSAFDNGSLTLAVTEDTICTIINNDEVSSVDLSITKTVDVDEPVVGTTVTFTLTVSNAAGGGDATVVEVVDIVPAGFTFVTGSMTGGDLQDQSSPSGTGLKWTINSLPAGAAAVVLTFQAVVNPP